MEQWLHFLTELSQLEARPERFLSEAVGALARLPWVSGASWRAGEAAGKEGSESPHCVAFANSALSLKIHSRYRMSPALNWHLHLLGLLLGEFYVAKLREEELRQSSYLQAVHETGARMTHDIKNLLQSLNVLCAAAAREENRDSPELQALMRRQLPVVAQRLAETLDKLQRPRPSPEPYVGVREWWEDLARQYRAEGVDFEPAEPPAQLRLPRSVFESIADNLIRNAIAKRSAAEFISVSVSLQQHDAGLRLRVCDTGMAESPEVVPNQLRAPIASHDGLGIGLYQAARLAESKGYRLELEENRDGRVCFALSGPAA
jgi:signal transduction histidine kinase